MLLKCSVGRVTLCFYMIKLMKTLNMKNDIDSSKCILISNL